MPCPLAEAIEAQRIWTSKAQYVDAERKFHTKVSWMKTIFIVCVSRAHSISQHIQSVSIWIFYHHHFKWLAIDLLPKKKINKF